MERVQTVKITLSNGRSGLFFGTPITDGIGGILDGNELVEVVDVIFESPRYVSGIQIVTNDVKDASEVDGQTK